LWMGLFRQRSGLLHCHPWMEPLRLNFTCWPRS
jgi:hypothetical protein